MTYNKNINYNNQSKTFRFKNNRFKNNRFKNNKKNVKYNRNDSNSSYKKNNNYPKKFYKNNILFLNKVFKEKKKSKFFSLKTVRGGLMITSLGLISFVPKSLVAKSNNKTQRIVNFKLLKKKHNFSFKQDLKINLVSSLKKT